jgi:hypothetical protein
MAQCFLLQLLKALKSFANAASFIILPYVTNYANTTTVNSGVLCVTFVARATSVGFKRPTGRAVELCGLPSAVVFRNPCRPSRRCFDVDRPSGLNRTHPADTSKRKHWGKRWNTQLKA